MNNLKIRSKSFSRIHVSGPFETLDDQKRDISQKLAPNDQLSIHHKRKTSTEISFEPVDLQIIRADLS